LQKKYADRVRHFTARIVIEKIFTAGNSLGYLHMYRWGWSMSGFSNAHFSIVAGGM
jgi:hypothetical protein